MDVFDNCRICLGEINHEPIKMTRPILGFLEKSLQLKNVTKPIPEGNVKQNLCAPCFNRIAEFQDFLEQCKDSDEFWKTQFDDLKEIPLDNELSFIETVFFPLTEDSNSVEADTTVSTTELKSDTHASEDETVHLPQIEMERSLQNIHEKGNLLLDTSSEIIQDKEAIQTKSFNNSIDLTNWTDDTNDDGEIEIIGHSDCDANTKNTSEQIIEYEYKVGEDEEVEIEEIATIDESASSDTSGINYRSFAYEKLEMETCSTIIHETVKNTLEEQNETTQSFFLTTSLDENGKVKMSYKCLHCDKIFNRIYDIESHCNIHNGVKPFNCNVCGKSFRQKNILTTHQALHFGKKVECAECGKKFARRSQLTLHYRMHRDEKPFVCNFDGCQAAFRQKKQLIDHSFIHTDEKNFQCATCSKSFHTRKRLQDHIYKVHSQHRYRCELCEKAFLKPHMLKHHMITAHNVEMDDVSHLKTSVDVLKPSKTSSR